MEMEASGLPRAGRESRGGGGEALLSAMKLPEVGWGGNGADGGEAGRDPGGEGEGEGLMAQVVAALTAEAGEVTGWVRLLPLGDEREPLWVDREALAAMVAQFEARGLDLVVDYEHPILSGNKAPAAG